VRAHKSRGGQQRNLVGFEVGAVRYAIDIARVREVVRPLPMLALPKLPSDVLGVADHRGVVVPVVDLRKRFGVQQASRDKDVRCVLVTRGTRLLGLLVDRVTEVLAGDARAEVPPGGTGPGHDERAIAAVCSHRGQLVFVLDVDLLTEAADALALPEIVSLQSGGRGRA